MQPLSAAPIALVSPIAASPPSQGIGAKLRSICQRIYQFILRIFQAFINLFRQKKQVILTPKEKQSLAAIKNFKSLPKYLSRNLTALIQRQPFQTPIDEAAFTAEAIDKQARKETREHLTLFSKNLGNLVTGALYGKHFKSRLDYIQANGPRYVNSTRLAANALLKVVGYETNIVIAIQQHRGNKPFDPDLQKVLSWLLKDAGRNLVEQKALKELQGSDLTLPNGQQFSHYLSPALNWLFNFAHNPTVAQPSISSIYNTLILNSTLIEIAIETIVGVLVEDKTELVTQKLDKIIEARLPDLIQKTIEANVDKLSAILSDRITDLLERIPFTSIIDKVFAIFENQVSSALKAEGIADSIVKKAKLATAQNNGNKQAELSEAIQELSKIGESSYKQKKFLVEFSQSAICQKKLKDLVAASKHTSVDIELLKRDLGRTFYPEFAKKVLTLLLPETTTQTRTGATQIVSGMEALWKELTIPEDFKDLLKTVKEISGEFLPSDIHSPLNALCDAVFARVERNLLYKAHKFLERFLTFTLQKQIENLIIPEKLNELAAFTFLASLNEILIQAFLGGLIAAQAESFALLFHRLLTHPQEKGAIYKEINEKLTSLVATQGFALQDVALTPQGLEKIIVALTDQIHHYFNLASNTRNLQPFTSDKALSVLQEYFATQVIKSEKETQETYNKLFHTLAFDLGKFGSFSETACGFGSVKHLITSAMLSAFDILRKSHVGLTILVTDAIRSTYLNKTAMEKMMFGAPEPVQAPAIVNSKLDEQLKIISLVAYKLIMQATDQSNWLIKKGVNSVLGGNAAALNKLLSNIYTKCFGNELLNTNFVLHIEEIFTKALTVAADDLSKQHR